MNEFHAQELLAAYPVLNQRCTVTPTVVRGEHWLIIKNTISASHVRLQRDLWPALCQLDGQVQLQQWLATHTPRFGDQRLLSAVLQLQRMSMLSAEGTPPSAESAMARIFARRNPLMLRIPLFNPTRMLIALCHVLSLVPGKILRWAFYGVTCLAMYLLFMHWSEVQQHWKETSSNTRVWHFFILYPFCKAVHELAHGWVLQRYGGQVPEAGVSFVVLFPLPYVDATDAWTLPRKKRMLVTGAGMLMDMFVASIAFIAWVVLSSGVLADMAFSVALISMVSIVLFNANPLLKFDGYYLLEDALDSPGLSRRSVVFYQHLFKKNVLKARSVTDPLVAKGEKLVLALYGFASPCYRVLISILICFYLITTFHEVGVLLSLFSVIPLIGFPLFRSLTYLLKSHELAGLRVRAVGVTSSILLVAAVIVFVLPVPTSTRTQGVVWVDKQAEIYASQSGQLLKVLVENGDEVKQGEPIMVLIDSELDLTLTRKQAAVRLARLEVERYRRSDPALASSAQIELLQAGSEAAHAKHQLEKLIVRSPESGRIAFIDEYSIPGIRVSQGELLAYVVNAEQRTIRTVVDQASLGRVSGDVRNVYVRLASTMGQKIPASLVRQIPAGSHQLPSAALIDTGFGGFDVEHADGEKGPRTRDKVFHLELAIQDHQQISQNVPVGTRAFVTLEHESEPLGPRWIRLGRQLLLKHLSV